MRKIIDYVTIPGDEVEEISRKSKEGYELIGGPFVLAEIFYQAMAKYEERGFSFIGEALRNIQKEEAEYIPQTHPGKRMVSIKKFTELFSGEYHRLMHCFTRSNDVNRCIVALHFDTFVDGSHKDREIKRLREAIDNYAILEHGKVCHLSMKTLAGDEI